MTSGCVFESKAAAVSISDDSRRRVDVRVFVWDSRTGRTLRTAAVGTGVTGVVVGFSNTAMRGRDTLLFASGHGSLFRSTTLMSGRDGVVGSVGTADKWVNDDMSNIFEG